MRKRSSNGEFDLALRYYAFCRPHQSLSGATPAEIYFGFDRDNRDPVRLPRGRTDEGPATPLCKVEYLDLEGRFPVLAKAA